MEPADTDTSSVPKTRSHKTMTDDDFDQLPAENIDWEQLGSENRELLRNWSQRKERELLDVAAQCQHASSVCPVGRDRFFRWYWVFRSVPGLFVEDTTVDIPFCEPAQNSNGPSRSAAPTSVEVLVPAQSRWSVYGSVEDVDRLLENLNSRGLREGPLRSVLVEQRGRLKDWVSQCDVAALTAPDCVIENKTASDVENESLVDVVRELILDLEERVHSGSLGSLKV